VELSPDGGELRIVWDGVRSEYGGKLDIRLTETVRLTGQQAVFSLEIDNRSAYTVEDVNFPCVAHLSAPEGSEAFKSFWWNYDTAGEASIYPGFSNMRGYYGFDTPVQASWAPNSGVAPASPFILLMEQNAGVFGQGLYVGVNEPSSEAVAWFAELYPGYDSSIDQHTPTVPEISGKDVSVRFSAAHVPFILPGGSRALTPIALEAFTGGWQAGADIYRAWRDGWMRPPEVPAWARDPHSWQQIHINSPEDELRVKFKDLPEIGRECAEHGVKAIQLVGWNDGGQDQGNPSHDPDPRLGTFEELREAIAKIQSYGVKLVLFAKFVWADRATRRFRDDLIRLSVKDPYGDYYMHGGYQYQTTTQMLDINTKRLIPMCFLSDEYLKICDKEFLKTVELGADGILFDECLHHGPALLCFDNSHGHRYGAPVYANDRKLIEGFRALLPEDKKDSFLFAGESCYDWEMEVYHLSYHRSESMWHIPLARYLLPHADIMTAVTGFDDRNMINQCLMYRYIVSYEPYNFKGRLSDAPLTVAYGQKMDALRTELRDYLWDGEFRHECGAAVKDAAGNAYRPYGVFIREDGRTGVVVCNYSASTPVTVRVTAQSGEALNRYRLVDGAKWLPAADGAVIPPRSAAVVIG